MSGQSALWELQKVLYSALTGSSTLMAQVKGVFDYVPENQDFPYVLIGEAQEFPSDVMGKLGRSVSATIRVYSRYPGMAEAEAIMTSIHTALEHVALAPTGWTNYASRCANTVAAYLEDGTREVTLTMDYDLRET